MKRYLVYTALMALPYGCLLNPSNSACPRVLRTTLTARNPVPCRARSTPARGTSRTTPKGASGRGCRARFSDRPKSTAPMTRAFSRNFDERARQSEMQRHPEIKLNIAPGEMPKPDTGR
jgi:hypothetical protein